ncbi:MAG TPA: thiamine phosphate synthase [Candidatus Polarisedimenticolia bacterium]|nr:thiamine phosphate synthase [Candidatus Polarisedimenticolia bacterium]
MIRLPRLYAITDRRLAGGAPHEEIVARLCRGGAALIQMREKDLPSGALLEAARAAVAAARAAGARLIVNDRADVAALAGADGVHLGGEDLPAGAARLVLGPRIWIGVSTHGVEEAAAAGRLPVDYVALGPIFDTPHAAVRRAPLGLAALHEAAALCPRPLVAIGGMDPSRAREALAAGAASVAVMGDLMTAPDIAARVRDYP